MTAEPTNKTWKLLRWFTPAVFVALPILLSLMFTSLAVSKHGGGGELWTLMLLIALLMFVALLALLVSLPLLFFKKTRIAAVLICLWAVDYLLGFSLSPGISWRIQRNAYAAVAQRSRPLIQAINAFTKECDHPPETLEQLVPRFIEAVPGTGMGACPSFEYVTGGARPTLRGERLDLARQTTAGGHRI
ncbi:MAG TPA: hypothetical protein VI136_10010 [Verrucomicrobiae bacterium]